MNANMINHKKEGKKDGITINKCVTNFVSKVSVQRPNKTDKTHQLSLSQSQTPIEIEAEAEAEIVNKMNLNAGGRTMPRSHYPIPLLLLLLLLICGPSPARSIRVPDRVPETRALKKAVFSLGCFWRSEAVFGCLNGVVRTSVGYSGGSKPNPDYRNLADHAESVQVEYDSRVISFRQLLEVFWSNHDSRQVFGQGPDVGNQYRSIIFTNSTSESRLAAITKEREQAKSKSSVVTTQILPLGTFYPAEPEHQKFELKRRPFLLHLIGNLPEEELEKSGFAAKMNSYAAELCPPTIQKQINAKINDIIRKGWPVLADI